MPVVCYQLFFQTPLRVPFYPEGAASAIVTSDSLYAAVLSAWQKLFSTATIENFTKEPRFSISSLFPLYVHGGKVTFFYPMPLFDHDELCPQDKLRGTKIRYIASDLLLPLIRGQRLPVNDCSLFHSNTALAKFEVPTETRFFSLTPVGGFRRNGKINHSLELVFNRRCGLFFLAEFYDDEIKREFEAALRLLADDGLGGGRTFGRGNFTFTIEARFEIPAQGGNMHLLLSRYVPTESETVSMLNLSRSKYELASIGGGDLANGMRLNSVTTFCEGSLLYFNKKPAITGKIIESVPENKSKISFPRFGRGFFIATGV